MGLAVILEHPRLGIATGEGRRSLVEGREEKRAWQL